MKLNYCNVHFIFLALLFGSGCSFLNTSTGKLDLDQLKNNEFFRDVKIETVPAEAGTKDQTNQSLEIKRSKKTKDKMTQIKSKNKKKDLSGPRMPDVEERSEFPPGSRRPEVNPFIVGEKVVHNVSYFGASAGQFELITEPLVNINKKKNYHFQIKLKTSRLFSIFYRVQNSVDVYLDESDLTSPAFQVKVDESKQQKESSAFFDYEKLKGKYWEKVLVDGEFKEKNVIFDFMPYTQNAFSAVFYARIFKWSEGKTYKYFISNNQKNILFSGAVEKKELLNTKLGPKMASKVKISIEGEGKLKPVGDIFIWFSDDDQRYILRVEAKIKIGTLVSEVTEIVNSKKPEEKK